MQERYPNIQVFYSTKRQVHSATDNELIRERYGTKVRIIRPNVIDYNRLLTVSVPVMRLLVGFLHGILVAYDPQTCIDFATAASALKTYCPW